MDRVVEVISGKSKQYIIKENVNGFYAEVRPLSKLRMFKERLSDYFGSTSIHPSFLDNWYHNSIDSVRWKVNVHESLS